MKTQAYLLVQKVRNIALVLSIVYLVGAGLLIPQVHVFYPLILFILLTWSGYCVTRILLTTPTWSSVARLSFGGLLGYLLLALSVFAYALFTKGTGLLTRDILLVMLGILMTIVTCMSGVYKSFEVKKSNRTETNLKSWVPLGIFILLSLIIWLFNPLAQNNDGFLEISLSYFHNAPASLQGLRPIFSLSQAAVSFLSDLSPLTTYSIVPLILFLLGVTFFWASINKDYRLLLIILTCPVVLTEILTTRPQVVLLAYTLPFFLLTYRALQDRSWPLTSLCGLMAITLITFHELGIFYLLTTGCVGFYLIVQEVALIKRVRFRHVLRVLIILLPYFFLFPFSKIFGQLIAISRYTVSTLGPLQWNWWFIDSYRSIDGAQLGWPGPMQAGLYYMYNGLLLYAFALVAWLLFTRRLKKKTSDLLPLYFFLSIFLFFAEIAPRFGFTFLLNRTWPYIALTSIFIVTIHLYQIPKINRLTPLLGYTLFPLAAIGLIGTLVVARDNVSQVFPSEKPVFEYIKANTPSNSLILSNQPNATLVEIYGERQFTQILRSDLNNTQNLPEYVDVYLKKKNEQLLITQTTLTTLKSLDGNPLSHTESTTSSEEIVSREPAYKPEGVYYIYSKRKARDRNASRTSVYTTTGLFENEELSFDRKSVVFEDDASVLVRLQ